MRTDRMMGVRGFGGRGLWKFVAASFDPAFVSRLAPAVELANERLGEAGEVPLPKLTPHKLRHSYASLLVALGTDPGACMDQLGHTDPAFTLRVYRHSMRRDPASRLALRKLVGLADERSDWADAIAAQHRDHHGTAAP